MRLSKILKTTFYTILLASMLFGAKRERVDISFNNLKIIDLVKMTSKILNKNILVTNNIVGKVNFISSKPIYSDQLLTLVQSILATKGYTIIDSGPFMQVVRLSEASKYNLPVVKKDIRSDQLITRAIKIKNANVTLIAAKIRHLISRSAKLIVVKENNSILLTDFPSNIKTVEKVIRLIENDNKKRVIFIKIQNVKVRELYTQAMKITKDMFDQKTPLDKVTLIPNNESNSIAIVGFKKIVDKVKDIVERLDKKDDKQKQIVRIFSLKNSEAKNIFKTLQFIIKSKKYPSKLLTPTISIDSESNSIIILGPKSSIDDISKIIKELDREKMQVYVKARIIEVNENLTDNIGIKYGLEAGAVSGSGLFNIASSLGSSPIVAGTLSSYVKLDSTIKDGLILGATIDFLKTNSAVDVVSEPSILCINNKESSIYVGETKSIQTGQEITSGGNTINKYSRQDIGLTLKIKPLISNDNKVTLYITTILEDVQATQTNQQPDTSKKEIKTVALVRNGENVIIGGLIKNKNDKTVTKVPLLGDLPVLGLLFKHTNKVKNKINLVVILTPYIINKSEDLTKLRKRLTKINAIQEKLYKNIATYLEKKKSSK